MGMYRDLAKNQGVYRILFAQLTARMPFGMLSLLMILHIEQLHQTYGAAGLVLAAASVGQAIAGPITSRWMGRWGMRPVLILSSIIAATSFTIIGVVFMTIPLTMLVAFVMGLSMPPVTPAVRTIYPKMVPSNQLTALYSLDASAQEIIWIFGPLLAVVISTQISSVVGVLVAVAFLIVGGAWFILSPELGKVRISRSRRRLGAVLTRPTVVIAAVIELIFVASFAAIEVGIVASFDHTSMESGVVLGIFSVGSITGGFLLGHRSISRWSLSIRLAIVAFGTALTLIDQGAVWLSISLFIAGLGVAPALAVLYTTVSATVKFSETAEAFGWMSTAMLIGAAAGSAIAGFAVDLYGPVSAITISLVFVILSVIVALITMKFAPDLRSGNASPLPDTEPVSVHYR